MLGKIFIISCLIIEIFTTSPPPPPAQGTVNYVVKGTELYTWETSNQNTYLCNKMGINILSGSGVNKNITCANRDWPLSFDHPQTPILTCPTGTAVKCFFFAGYGKVGGSCSEGGMKEDPAGAWAHLPVDAVNKLIGNQCTVLNTSKENFLNDVAISVPTSMTGEKSKKIKILAYCTTDAVTSSTRTECKDTLTLSGRHLFVSFIFSFGLLISFLI